MTTTAPIETVPETVRLADWFGSLADLARAARQPHQGTHQSRVVEPLPSVSALAAAHPTTSWLMTPLVALLPARRWPRRGGAIALSRRAQGPARGLLAPTAASQPLPPHVAREKHLADTLADRIRAEDYESIAALAREYRHLLERLGHVRSESTAATALRRFQEFLAAHVYSGRIAEAELPPRIRRGRATGGRRAEPSPPRTVRGVKAGLDHVGRARRDLSTDLRLRPGLESPRAVLRAR